MKKLPAPLVPPDLDLSDLPSMLVDIERLKRSKAWLRARRNPALGFYLFNLWTRAFHEVPAASIENDDDVLADAAGCEPHEWDRVRADATAGWVLCSDGRLYHPVVAEKAIEALAGRIKYGFAKAMGRHRQAKSRAERAKEQISPPPKLSDFIASNFSSSIPFLKQIQPFMPSDWIETADLVTVTTPNVTVTEDPCHSENGREGEGEGEGESYYDEHHRRSVRHSDKQPAQKRTARGRRLPPDPVRLTAFAAWWKACVKSVPRNAQRAKAERVWLKLDGAPQIDEMIEAWNAYLLDIASRSKGQRHPIPIQHPDTWLRGRVYENYLDDVRHRATQAEERGKARQATIEQWNGKATALIDKLGPARFDAMFVGTQLLNTADGFNLVAASDFAARYIREDTTVMRILGDILNKPFAILAPERRKA